MRNIVTRLVADDRGQDLIEYAILLAMIAVTSVGVMNALGVTLEAKYGAAADAISLATGSGMESGGRAVFTQWTSTPGAN